MFGALSNQRKYSTWDPAKTINIPGLTNNNKTISTVAASGGSTGTILAAFVKVYVEINIDLRGTGTGIAVGVWDNGSNIGTPPNFLGSGAGSWAYNATGSKVHSGSSAGYGATFTTGDNIGIMYDGGAGTLEFRLNGTSQGVAYTGVTSGLYIAASSDATGNAVGCTINCGATAFVYAVPSGYNSGLFS